MLSKLVERGISMEEKKSLFAEFKEFISRGSVVDLAVGVIIGAAFTAIVTALVADLFSPLIGWAFQGVDLASLKIVLVPAVGDAPENAILYGDFIMKVINFLLTALVVFLLVKAINTFRRKKEEAPAAPPEPSAEEALLAEIRDLLKAEKQTAQAE